MMSKINSFEDLLIWQKEINISVEARKLTSKFPKEEIFGLKSQLRRASTSISLNILKVQLNQQLLSFCNWDMQKAALANYYRDLFYRKNSDF